MLESRLLSFPWLAIYLAQANCMKIAIDHINIVVTDMDRSVAFYTTALGLDRGFEAMLEGDWIETVTGLPNLRAQCVFMEAGDTAVRLELLQYLTPAGTSLPPN